MSPFHADCSILSNLLPTLSEDGAHDKRDIRGPFAQPAHEIWKPFATEWDVHPNAIAFLDERRLQIPANAVQHLKFKLIRREVVLACELSREMDHHRIVCRDGRIVPGAKHPPHHPCIRRV